MQDYYAMVDAGGKFMAYGSQSKVWLKQPKPAKGFRRGLFSPNIQGDLEFYAIVDRRTGKIVNNTSSYDPFASQDNWPFAFFDAITAVQTLQKVKAKCHNNANDSYSHNQEMADRIRENSANLDTVHFGLVKWIDPEASSNSKINLDGYLILANQDSASEWDHCPYAYDDRHIQYPLGEGSSYWDKWAHKHSSEVKALHKKLFSFDVSRMTLEQQTQAANKLRQGMKAIGDKFLPDQAKAKKKKDFWEQDPEDFTLEAHAHIVKLAELKAGKKKPIERLKNLGYDYVGAVVQSESLVDRALREAESPNSDEIRDFIHQVSGVDPAAHYLRDYATILARLEEIAKSAQYDAAQFAEPYQTAYPRGTFTVSGAPKRSWYDQMQKNLRERAAAAAHAAANFRKYCEKDKEADSLSESNKEWYEYVHQIAGTDPNYIPLDNLLAAIEELNMYASIEADRAEEEGVDPLTDKPMSSYYKSILRIRANAIQQAERYLELYDDYQQKVEKYEAELLAKQKAAKAEHEHAAAEHASDSAADR